MSHNNGETHLSAAKIPQCFRASISVVFMSCKVNFTLGSKISVNGGFPYSFIIILHELMRHQTLTRDHDGLSR